MPYRHNPFTGKLDFYEDHGATPVNVDEGGTGNTSLTDGGILLGSGTNPVTVTSQPTDGQLLIGNTGSDPTLGTITAGNAVDVTNASGGITLAVDESSINLTNLAGTLAISQGGTGQTDQAEAFDALSPTTTKGDLIVSDGSDNVRLAIGNNNQVLTADSTQTSGVKWADAAGGGGAYAIPPFEDDGTGLNGILACDTNTTSTFTPADQTLYMQAIYVPADCTLNYLTAWVSTAVAGSTFRMGIYDHSGNTGPKNLIAESAELSSASTGVLDSAALSTELTAGWYWIGMTANLNSGSPVFRGIASFKQPVWYQDSGSAVVVRNAFYDSSIDPASSLPDPWTSTLTAAFSVTPGVWIRLAF